MTKKLITLFCTGAFLLSQSGCTQEEPVTGISLEEVAEPVASEASVEATPTFTPHTFVYGDVSGDGKIMANDYIMMRDFVLKRIRSFTASNGLLAADVSADGKILANDYALVRDYVLKRIDAFPAEIHKAQECLFMLGYFQTTEPVTGEWNEKTIYGLGHFQQWCQQKYSTVSYAERKNWEHLAGVNVTWDLDQKTLNALRLEAFRTGCRKNEVLSPKDGGGAALNFERMFYSPGTCYVERHELGYIRATYKSFWDFYDIKIHLDKSAFDWHMDEIEDIQILFFAIAYFGSTLSSFVDVISGDPQAIFQEVVLDQYPSDLATVLQLVNTYNLSRQITTNRFADGSSEIIFTLTPIKESLDGKEVKRYQFSPLFEVSGKLKIDLLSAFGVFQSLKLSQQNVDLMMDIIGQR